MYCCVVVNMLPLSLPQTPTCFSTSVNVYERRGVSGRAPPPPCLLICQPLIRSQRAYSDLTTDRGEKTHGNRFKVSLLLNVQCFLFSLTRCTFSKKRPKSKHKSRWELVILGKSRYYLPTDTTEFNVFSAETNTIFYCRKLRRHSTKGKGKVGDSKV